MPTDSDHTPVIGRANRDDADQLAALIRQVRLDNPATIPPPIHVLDDMCRWMREVVFDRYDVWAATVGTTPVGVLILGRPDWIEHFYVDSAHAGQGLGSRLMAVAKQELPGDIQLWTFQSNLGARRFYERHGFEGVETTNGDNEEQRPDVRYLLRR